VATFIDIGSRGLKVAGTVVLSAARELLNIVSATIGGVLTVTGKTIATGGIRTITASPNIPNNTATTVMAANPEGAMIFVSTCDNPGNGAVKFGVIVTNGGGFGIAFQSTSATVTWSLSGTNLQLTHTLGATMLFRHTFLLSPFAA
jgi:hypothetical protein